MEKLQSIINVAKEVFGSGNVSMVTKHQDIHIYALINNVTIEGEEYHDSDYDEEEEYFEYNAGDYYYEFIFHIDRKINDISFCAGVHLNSLTPSYSFLYCNVSHPHAKKLVQSELCFGYEGGISALYELLINNEYNSDTFYEFCELLLIFVTQQSADGGPYEYISRLIGLDNSIEMSFKNFLNDSVNINEVIDSSGSQTRPLHLLSLAYSEYHNIDDLITMSSIDDILHVIDHAEEIYQYIEYIVAQFSNTRNIPRHVNKRFADYCEGMVETELSNNPAMKGLINILKPLILNQNDYHFFVYNDQNGDPIWDKIHLSNPKTNTIFNVPENIEQILSNTDMYMSNTPALVIGETLYTKTLPYNYEEIINKIKEIENKKIVITYERYTIEKTFLCVFNYAEKVIKAAKLFIMFIPIKEQAYNTIVKASNRHREIPVFQGEFTGMERNHFLQD